MEKMQPTVTFEPGMIVMWPVGEGPKSFGIVVHEEKIGLCVMELPGPLLFTKLPDALLVGKVQFSPVAKSELWRPSSGTVEHQPKEPG